ncbi:hypothetical protein BT96DRAFT_1078920 [Gymnopus androsaceus JB14]|uniref:Uncharacterized protein n=1 Tax=Gymnopus androsaceus JB14 TaxID=1447944 RepID=A0A6A4GQ63_9AGAR|nr:hypothetical protein BT96DRAFT_1078920 [Gymnopus androsaceus JB14]
MPLSEDAPGDLPFFVAEISLVVQSPRSPSRSDISPVIVISTSLIPPPLLLLQKSSHGSAALAQSYLNPPTQPISIKPINPPATHFTVAVLCVEEMVRWVFYIPYRKEGRGIGGDFFR